MVKGMIKGIGKTIFLWFCLQLCVLLQIGSLHAMPLDSAKADKLKPVGEATLKVMFWSIYDARLYSFDGKYEKVEPGVTLSLQYRRDITSQKLVDTTRDQWRKLSLYRDEESEAWLKKLLELWPDIQRDDNLTLYVNEDMDSEFYLNGEAIGILANANFTEDFLAIWLSPDNNFPKFRKQLLTPKKED